MVTSVESARTRLLISAPLDLSETKILIKDLYSKIEELTKQNETLQNEIRKLSENRSRPNKDSGKPL